MLEGEAVEEEGTGLSAKRPQFKSYLWALCFAQLAAFLG